MVYKTGLIKTSCCNAQIQFTIDENKKITITCDNCECNVGEIYLAPLLINILISKSTVV